jgi:hypothetical protein
MAFFLVTGDFFNAAQTERLAEAIVLALVTLLSLVPVFVALLQIKLAREIREIRQNQVINNGRIEKICRRSDSDAREGEPVASGEVRDLREEGVVGRDRETGDFQKRRRDASLPMVQSEEVDRDQNSGG